MDLSHALDYVVSAFLAVAAFMAKSFHVRLSASEEKIANLHETYVKRDDFKESTERVFSILQRIEDKLDGKADK